MKATFVHTIVSLLLLSAVHAGVPGLLLGETPAPARATRSGEINLEASRVYVFVDKTRFGHQHAVVGRLSDGSLRIANSSAGHMVFDMNSFVADTPEARKYLGMEGKEPDADTRKQVNANMLGPDVLNVGHFPTARFEIDSLWPLDAKSDYEMRLYQIEGHLTLHGVTRPLKFAAEGSRKRNYLHLQGSFPLRQTDFKIKPFAKAFGAVGITDELKVFGDIWVKQ